VIRSIVTNEEKLTIPSAIIPPSEAEDIIKDMLDTAEHHMKTNPVGCAGLAANQIGKLVRIIVVKVGNEFVPMINPEITEAWAGKQKQREGCLSRPGMNPMVARHKKIKVSYETIGSAVTDKKFTKFTARVIQHEIDHLNGVYI